MATDRGRLSLAPASTKARMRQARQELSRGVILDAAERVFAERGFGAAKMHDVAALAKVSTSTVYELFEGKEALYEAVHTRHGAELLAGGLEPTHVAPGFVGPPARGRGRLRGLPDGSPRLPAHPQSRQRVGRGVVARESGPGGHVAARRRARHARLREGHRGGPVRAG
ncbi:MAG: helix-turn-helix transcriptional regulator [Sandaracinaceae bacterium]|nr:helix-turn-helix transcriptional regulator [Sandaracinaceae bacterium]